jgi:hypothetical protein
MNEPIIINTPEGIEHYRVAALIAALRIEVKTGMKMTRGISPLAVAKRDYGCPKGTKKGALAWMESYYEATYGWAY